MQKQNPYSFVFICVKVKEIENKKLNKKKHIFTTYVCLLQNLKLNKTFCWYIFVRINAPIFSLILILNFTLAHYEHKTNNNNKIFRCEKQLSPSLEWRRKTKNYYVNFARVQYLLRETNKRKWIDLLVSATELYMFCVIIFLWLKFNGECSGLYIFAVYCNSFCCFVFHLDFGIHASAISNLIANPILWIDLRSPIVIFQ